ncbi:hypothetical protein KDJ56_07055 [Brevibacillus composti]|uniref:Uncharacterized protein n=1 Tax=Brevibacillus composti TaxID=2796470 RepID=A0A7T5JQ22_9BACL|nr:hypothetical protein [Brevibacillus composti]QQE75191.1 hypothetical protein JD108_04470 [Brevibacillus composti]QQE75690.1 hypothetical protein JD108_07375 [Brevibacillus composti]QUO42716.1 hypothetical protein KDJ56_07055 [Brevibacillus composti]
MYKNPLIAPSLTDETTLDDAGIEVYTHDCHNLPICMSYGSHYIACLAGAYAGNRCSRGEKMNIRILNDMNPNATYKPEKPSRETVEAYIKG